MEKNYRWKWTPSPCMGSPLQMAARKGLVGTPGLGVGPVPPAWSVYSASFPRGFVPRWNLLG